MAKQPRTSIVPTLVILGGISVIVGPIVFASVYLPTQRLGLGVIVTLSACFGVPLVLAAGVITLGYFSNRHMMRYAMSQCTRCGYDLRGTDATRCAECGSLQRHTYE